MPLMEFEVQIETAKFYKNRTEIMKDTILDSRVSIRENEAELKMIDDYLDLLDKAWMEMEYCNKEYLKNFAYINGEKNLLEESGSIIYDLDAYYVDTIDGASKRNWIYECELVVFKKKLLENKRKIKDILTQSYISAGVSLALLRS
jgi:hypothetical protein